MESETDARPHTTRPALWQPPARPQARLDRALTFCLATLAVLATVAGAGVFAEPFVLASPARATIVTVLAVESLAQHEHTEPRYRVGLPDGSTARLHTPRVLQVGDRLTAMVSRGRITGRVFVGPPHSAPFRDRESR
jgi:hypothetical protein